MLQLRLSVPNFTCDRLTDAGRETASKSANLLILRGKPVKTFDLNVLASIGPNPVAHSRNHGENNNASKRFKCSGKALVPLVSLGILGVDASRNLEGRPPYSSYASISKRLGYTPGSSV